MSFNIDNVEFFSHIELILELRLNDPFGFVILELFKFLLANVEDILLNFMNSQFFIQGFVLSDQIQEGSEATVKEPHQVLQLKRIVAGKIVSGFLFGTFIKVNLLVWHLSNTGILEKL